MGKWISESWLDKLEKNGLCLDDQTVRPGSEVPRALRNGEPS